jgi:hypothetical protein
MAMIPLLQHDVSPMGPRDAAIDQDQQAAGQGKGVGCIVRHQHRGRLRVVQLHCQLLSEESSRP